MGATEAALRRSRHISLGLRGQQSSRRVVQRSVRICSSQPTPASGNLQFARQKHYRDRQRLAGSLGFNSLDLCEQQFQTIEFSADFGLEVFWERRTVATPKFFKTLAAISIDRLVIPNSLRGEQPLSAVDVEDTFRNQSLPFPADPTLSSSSGVRSLTIEHARDSPRFPRISVSPSMRSVFPRRCRRGIAIAAASIMWLSIQASWLCALPRQMPSSPTFWITAIR